MSDTAAMIERRPLTPGQSDLDDRQTRQITSARPDGLMRPRVILEPRTTEWASTDPWDTAAEEVWFDAKKAAGSLDGRFGTWTWTVWVDSAGRQVADTRMTWVPRLPASSLWGLSNLGDIISAGGYSAVDAALGLPDGETFRRLTAAWFMGDEQP